MFPLHLNEILSAAEKFDPNVEKYREKLEIERDIALRGFKKVYLDHLAFIREKGIGLSNPLEMVKISSARRENIKTAVVSFLVEHTPNFIPREAVAGFENSFPKILDLITTFISDRVKENLSESEVAISSYEQLLCHRTLCIYHDSDWCITLRERIFSELRLTGIIKSWMKTRITHLIFDVIFTELAKGKEIAYYNPSHGGNGSLMCIFC